MAAKKIDIYKWLEIANFEGYTHVIVVCDTFNYLDYPIYVTESEDVKEKEKYYNNQKMQQVKEVYSLSHDIEEQLAEDCSFHYD